MAGRWSLSERFAEREMGGREGRRVSTHRCDNDGGGGGREDGGRGGQCLHHLDMQKRRQHGYRQRRGHDEMAGRSTWTADMDHSNLTGGVRRSGVADAADWSVGGSQVQQASYLPARRWWSPCSGSTGRAGSWS